MSNKFLLTTESNAATNPLEEDLDANGHSINSVNQLCMLSLSGNQTCLQAGDNVSLGYNVDFPNDPPSVGDVLEITAGGSIWTPNGGGSGDVVGPGSSTDEAICRYDGATGKLIQNSILTLDDSGDIFKSGNNFLHTIGVNNLCLGNLNMRDSVAGFNNVAIGEVALVTGINPEKNVAVGFQSLQTCGGANNVGIGHISGVIMTSGSRNTSVGSDTISGLGTGTDNLILGYQAGDNYTSSESNNILLANKGLLSESDTIRIGLTGTHDNCFIAGIHGVTPFGTTQVVIIDTAGELGSRSDFVVELNHTVGDIVIFDNLANTVESSGVKINPLDQDITGVNNIEGVSLTMTGADKSSITTTSVDSDAILLKSDGGIKLEADFPILLSHIGGVSPNGIDLLCTGVGAIRMSSATNAIITTSTALGALTLSTGAGGSIDFNNTIRLKEAVGTDTISISAPALGSSYSLILPDTDGLADELLTTDGTGVLTWAPSVYPPGYIEGWFQTYSTTDAIDFGLSSGTANAGRSDLNDYNFDMTGTVTASFTLHLTVDQTKTADTSYEWYRIGDTTAVNADTYLVAEEGTDLTTLTEFTSSDFDTFLKIGWCRTDSSNDILKHFTNGKGSYRLYMFDTARNDVIVLSSGSATTFTDVDCSNFCDPNTHSLMFRVSYGDLSGTMAGSDFISFRGNGSSTASGSALFTLKIASTTDTNQTAVHQIFVPTSDRIIEYRMNNAADDSFLYVAGFKFSLGV